VGPRAGPDILEKNKISFSYGTWGRDSAVGPATRDGLDGPGIESRWGRDFTHLFRPDLGATQPPIQWVPGLSPGVKQPERGVDHPPPSSAEFEGRVELYICSPFGSSWIVLGRTLPLTLPLPYENSNHVPSNP
jgi:hypothetical protein